MKKFTIISKISLILCLYLITACTNDDGEEEPILPIINYFQFSNTEVYIGDSLEISWSSLNASYCEASGDWTGIKSTIGNEQIELTEKKNYSFTLDCFGKDNTSSTSEITLDVTYRGYFFDDSLYIFENNLFLDGMLLMDLDEKILVDFVKLNNSYFIFWYNSNENTASGQKLDTIYVGLELDIFSEGFKQNYKNLFIESSFESIFKKTKYGDSFFMCSDQECYRFYESGDSINLKISEFTNDYAINSINFDTNLSLELIRKVYPQELFDDDHQLYDRKGIVFDENLILLEALRDVEDDEFNFVSQLELNSFNKIYSFQDNSEGRIVWGQKYYFDAILFKDNLSISELDLINKNLDFYLSSPNLDLLLSQRYSYNRSSQLFLLHVSRYYNMLKSLDSFISEDNLSNYNSQISLLEDLLLFSNNSYSTVETLSIFNFMEYGPQEYLIFRNDSDFWANSINVPINYASDYIIALLNVNTNDSLDIAISLLEINFSLIEKFNYPSWRYWSGSGLTGWDDMNINVPVYEGELNLPYAADIIYRSTDAKSFLIACSNEYIRETVSFSCSDVEDNIFLYIKNTSLEPYLLEHFESYVLSNEEKNKLRQKFMRFVVISDIKNLYYINERLAED